MVLKYEKNLNEIFKTLEIFNSEVIKDKKERVLLKSTLFFIYPLNKLKGNVKTEIKISDDGILCKIKKQEELIKFSEQIEIGEKENFVFLKTDEELRFAIPNRVFKSNEEKEEFINTIKSNIAKEDFSESEERVDKSRLNNGVLENHLTIEQLTEGEIEEKIYKYSHKKSIYKQIATVTIADPKERKFNRFIAILNWLLIVVILYTLFNNKMDLDLKNAIILPTSLISIITSLVLRFFFFKKQIALKKYINDNIDEKEIAFGVLKTEGGILYKVADKTEFIENERIKSIEEYSSWVFVTIKDYKFPITIINLKNFDKKGNFLIEELKKSYADKIIK